MPIDVPAHINHGNYTVTGIDVKGGSNWDLSRSAAETPIRPATPHELFKAGRGPNPSKGESPCFCKEEDPSYEGSPYKVADKVPKGAPFVSISFKEGSAQLSAESVALIKKIPSKSKLVLIGNAGLKETNPHKLAEARIYAVKKAATANKIKVSVTQAMSFGNSRYQSADSVQDRLNRRVDVWVNP